MVLFYPTMLFVNVYLYSRFGRGCFLESQMLVVQSNHAASSPSFSGVTWAMLRVIGFDEPSHSMWAMPFEKRYKKLAKLVDPHHPLVVS